MAENEANLLARFISVGASEMLKDMNAVGSAGVNNEKILNRLITLEQRKASTAKLTAATTLETERQKTAAIRNRAREEELAFRKTESIRRREIQLLNEASAAHNRYASIIKSGGTGGGLAGGGAINMLGRAGLVGAVAYAGIRTLLDMSENAAKWEQLDVAIRDIEGSASGAALQLDRLYEIAKAPGIDLETGEKIYIKLRSVGIEGEKANRIVEQFAKTVSKSGGGSLELSRVVEQLVQMQSKGRILQEDLKFMTNSMPRLRGMLEEAFGTSNAEKLRDMGVDAKMFLEGVLGEMEKLDPATRTLQTSTENLATAFSRLKADATPTEFLKSVYDWLTKAAEKSSELLRNIGQISVESRAKQSISEEYSRAQMPSYTIDRVTGDTLHTDTRTRLPYFGTKSSASGAGVQFDYTGQTSQQMLAGSQGASIEAQRKAANTAAQREKDAAAAKRARWARGEFTDEELKAQKKAKKAEDAAQNRALDFATFDLEKMKSSQDEAEQLQSQYHQFVKNLEDERQSDALEAASFDMNRMGEKQAEAEALRNEDRQKEVANWVALQGIKDEYLKTDFERQKDHYEAVRQMILATTIKGSEEQTQLLNAVNKRQADERLQTILSAEAQLASGVSGMFGEFANAYKMRSDYRYEREKASIEKTLSLNGLEGRARVLQQQRRDEALAKLDEKRQKDMAGTYQTMFMISKGFALAESMLMLSAAVAKAAAGAPFPANLANMAAVAAATGSVVGNIAAINYSGAYNKGGDIPAGSFGMVGDGGPEFVQGPAHVTSVKDTAALLKPTVNVHNYSGQSVQVQPSPDGAGIDVIIGQIARKVEDQLSTGMRSGRGQLASAVKESFGLTRKG